MSRPTWTPSYGPMHVTRVHGELESHIEPALSDRWTPIDRLRWAAGVAKVDSGLTIRIRPLLEQDHEAYGLEVSGQSWNSGGYQRTWRTISDLSIGAEALNSDLHARLDAAAALHQPCHVIGGIDPTNPEREGTGDVCWTCSDKNGDDFMTEVRWPCPTAVALGVAA